MMTYKDCQFRPLKISDLRPLLDKYEEICQRKIEKELKGKMNDEQILNAVLNMKLQMNLDHIVEFCGTPEGVDAILSVAIVNDADYSVLNPTEAYKIARSLIGEADEVKKD